MYKEGYFPAYIPYFKMYIECSFPGQIISTIINWDLSVSKYLYSTCYSCTEEPSVLFDVLFQFHPLKLFPDSW